MKKVLIGIGVGLTALIVAFMAFIAIVVANDDGDMFNEDDWLD